MPYSNSQLCHAGLTSFILPLSKKNASSFQIVQSITIQLNPEPPTPTIMYSFLCVRHVFPQAFSAFGFRFLSAVSFTLCLHFCPLFF
uniref:Uncharacterized protein n=1 Tax=Caenorhabditis japonica TaxID=281687 RepID=A0A8R1IQZ1_CAEJA